MFVSEDNHDALSCAEIGIWDFQDSISLTSNQNGKPCNAYKSKMLSKLTQLLENATGANIQKILSIADKTTTSIINNMAEPGHGIDTLLNTFDEVQDARKQGYLAIEGELHYNHGCKYVRCDPFEFEYKLGEGPQRTYVMNLLCHCTKQQNPDIMRGRSELHFSDKCGWKRIKDRTYTHREQKTYLVRKCQCFQPLSDEIKNRRGQIQQ